jgi:hypothetical protein
MDYQLNQIQLLLCIAIVVLCIIVFALALVHNEIRKQNDLIRGNNYINETPKVK